MKRMGLLGIFLFATSAFGLEAFPSGTFAGEGYWKSPKGDTGKYTAELNITGTAMTMKIVLDNGEVHESTTHMKMKDHGFFSVTKDGETEAFAHGYCGSVWCHVGGHDDNGHFEETFVFMNDTIYRLGSAKMEHGFFMWEDALKQK